MRSRRRRGGTMQISPKAKRRADRRKYRERFRNDPWTQEERESRHTAFSRLKTPKQVEAKRRLEIVQFFRSLDGSDAPLLERYAMAARKGDVSVSTVRTWVGKCRNIDRGDWLIALAPEHKGWVLNTEISSAAYDWIRTKYFKPSQPALLPIYRLAASIASEQSWTLPSYHTVKRLIKREARWFHAMTREGKEAFEKLYPNQLRDYGPLPLHQFSCFNGRIAGLF